MFHVKHKIVRNERPRPSFVCFWLNHKVSRETITFVERFTPPSLILKPPAADFRIFPQKVFLFTDDFRRGDFVSYLIIAFRVFLSLITLFALACFI